MLQIKLELEKASRGERVDRYYAQEDDWFFEVRVPRGERPEDVDVHFKFSDDDASEKS